MNKKYLLYIILCGIIMAFLQNYLFNFYIKNLTNLIEKNEFNVIVNKSWLTNGIIIINDSLYIPCYLVNEKGVTINEDLKKGKIILEKFRDSDTIYTKFQNSGTIINTYLYVNPITQDEW